MIKNFILLFSLLVSMNAMTQVTHASISQHEVTIGERVTLSYSLPLKFSENIGFEPWKRFIPAIVTDASGKSTNASSETVEILSPFKDTIISGEEGPTWTGYYEITVWDSGAFTLPGPTISLGTEKLQFPSVSFAGTLTPAIKGVDTYDIKETFAELPPQTFQEKLNSFLSHYWWLLALVMCMLVTWFWFKRKNRRLKQQEIELPLYERTVQKLEEIEKKEAWKSGKIKLHYSELSFILRNYISELFGLQLLERTTLETLLILEHKLASKETHTLIRKILETSDLVKFAKLNPQESDVKNHIQDSYKLITILHEQTQTRVADEQ